VFELREAEWRVAECNALIECQRLLIEGLAREGRDITSAQIVLDSLHISLYLHMQERHRLRVLNGESDDSTRASFSYISFPFNQTICPQTTKSPSVVSEVWLASVKTQKHVA
jgi:hypothetical protein